MFDIKKEIPSSWLCKKLKELGFPQEGGSWYWLEGKLWLLKNNILWALDGGEGRSFEHYKKLAIKAPTCAELFSFIPPSLSTTEWFFIVKSKNDYGDVVMYSGYRKWITHPSGGVLPQEIVRFSDDSLPNLLANIIIWLFEEGQIK